MIYIKKTDLEKLQDEINRLKKENKILDRNQSTQLKITILEQKIQLIEK